MGFSKEERRKRFVRWIKTLFFLIAMLMSLLLFSAPILLVIADALLPSALLSASLSLNLQALSSHVNNYDFRSSLIDIPLVSIIRAAIILCVYSFCDGPRLSRGPYLGIATICSVLSLAFVSLKAAYVFSDGSSINRRGNGYSRAVEVTLFACSFGLAIGHVIVAYRTSCRERRKLLIYKIDIEAVSACKNGFPRHQKSLQVGRAKSRQKQISIPHFFLNQIQFSKSQVSDLSKGDLQPDEERSKETQKL
ncbi:uncharacterized protein LOC111403083 isoform X2 [Olea europaea var. sylvestris]|uniref:uncharacterized protein LOC111403083 isoform X2 n=1 Tax=Olea europaea var. sylvestris TaxID=158386 RepID=UPI000C1D7706|nr:uncharacterized protein LOC111403083 isoform X2 [Olea europaea var. sylvestris]